jgi:DNA-binding XRE family transcriptional regulator
MTKEREQPMSSNELAEIRERLGFSQVKMAEELGLSRRGYQFLENGERNISKTVAILARLIEKTYTKA